MKLTSRHWIAVSASSMIIIGWAIYWILQIQDVIELLEMAYG